METVYIFNRNGLLDFGICGDNDVFFGYNSSTTRHIACFSFINPKKSKRIACFNLKSWK